MQLIISGRNTEVSEEIREQIEAQFEKLRRYEPRASRAEVTLWEEHQNFLVEAVVSIDRRPRLHGEADGDAFRTALDRLHDKLARQLKKSRAKRRDHRAPPLEALLPQDDQDDQDDEDDHDGEEE
jgi:ribosomal subunit interface protein